LSCRYDVAGALQFFLLKGYDATVWYKPAPAAAAAAAAPSSEDGYAASSSSDVTHCDHSQQQQQHGRGLLEPLVSSAALSPLPHQYMPGLHAGKPAYNHSHKQQQQQDGSSVCSSSLRVSFETPSTANANSSTASLPVVDAAAFHKSKVAAQQYHWYPAVAAVHASAGSISSSMGSSSAAAANAASHRAGSSAGSSAGSVASTSAHASGCCHTGCALCGTAAAAMQRSSSRRSFTQESASTQQHTATTATAAAGAEAASLQQPPGPGWVKVEGRYASIMAVVTSCRSDKSRSGVCPEAHLADGRLVLVMVEKRSRLAYLRFLLQLATKGVVPGALPFVRVEHVTDLQVSERVFKSV
jgi:hypothetical protein